MVISHAIAFIVGFTGILVAIVATILATRAAKRDAVQKIKKFKDLLEHSKNHAIQADSRR